MAVTEESNGPQAALGSEVEVEPVQSRQSELAENTKTAVCEEDNRSLETSFKHLWSDYSVDWKDTRRYPGDGAAAPHRKLCTFVPYVAYNVYFVMFCNTVS